MTDDPLAALGRTDIYVLDQFMRGRFQPGTRVLDAGCGKGRNLDLFVRGGYEVWLADESGAAVQIAQDRAAAQFGVTIPDAHTHCGRIETLDVPPAHFDAVLSIAVLHFASDPEHWREMVDAMWRALAPGGIFFARLASNIGIEDHVTPLGDGSYRLPDGKEWYLVTLDDLLGATRELGAELADPIKTVNVQNKRCMTNWCIRKP